MGIEVQKYTWNIVDSNMYILRSGNSVLVIDPVADEDAIEQLKDADEVCVLLTHEHFDHISGLNKLRELCQGVVIAQKQCSERIQNCKKNLSYFADIFMNMTATTIQKSVEPFVCRSADVVFEDSYRFVWQNHLVELSSTPGHSPGSMCIAIERLLFTGDIILENVDAYRFPDGDRGVYITKTIPVLVHLLEDSDVVYPGHGSSRDAKYFRTLLDK